MYIVASQCFSGIAHLTSSLQRFLGPKSRTGSFLAQRNWWMEMSFGLANYWPTGSVRTVFEVSMSFCGKSKALFKQLECCRPITSWQYLCTQAPNRGVTCIFLANAKRVVSWIAWNSKGERVIQRWTAKSLRHLSDKQIWWRENVLKHLKSSRLDNGCFSLWRLLFCGFIVFQDNQKCFISY